jgi:hypothetical protein
VFTKQYWLSDSGVLVRAIRTWAQTAVASVGVGTTNLFSADIKNVLALSTSAAIISVLMSLDRSADVKSAMKTPGVYVTETEGQSDYDGDCGIGTVR